jgi:putative membrane protein
MSFVLLIIGAIFVVLAALFHLVAFVLESIRWSRPSTWRSFGVVSQQEADIVRPMAFNQGFYNLFLALGAGAGVATIGVNQWFGFALILFCTVSMFFAGVVLFFSVPTSRRAALGQALPPFIGLVLIAIGLSLGMSAS